VVKFALGLMGFTSISLNLHKYKNQKQKAKF
jgi:hypothetical protein